MIEKIRSLFAKEMLCTKEISRNGVCIFNIEVNYCEDRVLYDFFNERNFEEEF